MNRVEDFRRWLQRAAADRTIETRNGTGIVSDSVPDVYDANYLSVESPVAGAGDLTAQAETVLETSHHCRVIVEDGSPGLADDFAHLGFDRVTHLVLAHTGEPDRRVDTSAVREVGLDELLRRLERNDEARAAFDRALELTPDGAERRFLERRVSDL